MTTEMMGALAMIGFLTILAAAGCWSLRLACRDEKPSPDWLQWWGE